MKIKVKDYYARKRGVARANALNTAKRKEISKKGAMKRWKKLKEQRQQELKTN